MSSRRSSVVGALGIGLGTLLAAGVGIRALVTQPAKADLARTWLAANLRWIEVLLDREQANDLPREEHPPAPGRSSTVPWRDGTVASLERASRYRAELEQRILESNGTYVPAIRQLRWLCITDADWPCVRRMDELLARGDAGPGP